MASHLLALLSVATLLIFGSAQGNQCIVDTYKIQGNGQIYLTPDIAIMSISSSGNGTTAAIALANLNIAVNAIIQAFKTLKIPMGNYSTSTITIYNTYNYNTNPYTITGSQASQTLQLTIGASTNLVTLLQALGNITNVAVNNINYDVLDHSSALQKARVAAFTDARNKFSQYLGLSGKKNLGLLKIQDQSSQVYTTYQYTPSSFVLLSLLRVTPNPVQITASVSVTWRINK